MIKIKPTKQCPLCATVGSITCHSMGYYTIAKCSKCTGKILLPHDKYDDHSIAHLFSVKTGESRSYKYN